RGPGQDDAVDLLGLQGLYRLGHGEIRLAGAGGADAEDDGVLVDRVHVTLLVERLGADRAPARGEDVLGEDLRGGLLAVALTALTRLEHGDRAFHRVLRHRLSG